MKVEKKEKQVDLNGDGIMDRIIVQCLQDRGSEDSCIATQVEMGTSDGQFVPVFKRGPKQEIAEGERLIYSSQFYYDKALKSQSLRYVAEQ